MDTREVQVNRNDQWVNIEFNELYKDEDFRMFESTGEEVRDSKGNTVFRTTSEPYLNNDEIWQIDVIK
jgi:hypothetical protein